MDIEPPSLRDQQGALLGALWESGRTRFRVWAPHAKRVEVVVESSGEVLMLDAAERGYYVGESSAVRPGSLYRYRLDGEGLYPDPCSRFQPEGPHGPSMVVDPAAYEWTDAEWRGVSMRGQVIYELHVGTFTPDGTFDAACEKLEYLRELGVTVIEVMPLAECPGRWNWGYDGVQLFAPYHVYGDHEAFKRFVNRAHELGLAVILDVVYNHLGPDGNYLRCFAPEYFSKRYQTEWGEPFNVDGELGHGARDYIVENARYWVREVHVDGYRLDATQSIFDASPTHVIAELITAARAAARDRQIIIVAENEPQRAEQLKSPEEGGCGLDGMWNDDYHHSARVAMTGSREGYYHDYTGRPQEFISALKRGFLYQGQHYHWQKKQRGSSLPRDWDPSTCVIFLQNHDQVANTFTGTRCNVLTSQARLRALTALTLLAPQTPLIFMGEEFAASTPFMFFADHNPELNGLVHQGRREFVAQFPSAATSDVQQIIPDPRDPSTFERSKLNWDDVSRHAPVLRMHEDLLALRRADPVIAQQQVSNLDGAVLSDRAFLIRWFDDRHQDRMLLVNLGEDCVLDPAPEPLLAAPPNAVWSTIWCSNRPEYGGLGAPDPVDDEARWRIPAESAYLLVAKIGNGSTRGAN